MFHRGGLAQCPAQTVAVEDVVAEHQRARLTIDELLAEDECLGQTIRGRLHLVREAHAILGAVSQQTLEVRQILRRGDDQNVTDARHHQHAQRVVDHRLVIHGKQLLRGHRGQRVQSRARTSSENNAFHEKPAFHNVLLIIRLQTYSA